MTKGTIIHILSYQRKREVIYLKALGLPHHEISRVAGICENTLLSYVRAYQEGGIEKLKEIRFRRPESELSVHQTSLEAYFREHPPASVNEAAAKIEELTGIISRLNRVRVYMKKLGMRRYKVGTIPAKADVEEQEKFKKEELEPQLEEARAGKRTIFL
jgi:Transposase and inactivated derivatives